MKILSNDKYKRLISNNNIIQNENEELNLIYKEMTNFYDGLLNEIYNKLIELNNNISSNISYIYCFVS